MIIYHAIQNSTRELIYRSRNN